MKQYDSYNSYLEWYTEWVFLTVKNEVFSKKLVTSALTNIFL